MKLEKVIKPQISKLLLRDEFEPTTLRLRVSRPNNLATDA